MVMKLVPPRIKQETDQKIREELEAQVNEAKDTLANAKGRALNYFRKALQKAGPDTTADDLNTVRYFLCYLEYEAGNYFNALTYGQFLAYRYPSSPGAKQGALIAMASCQKLYAEDKEANHDFESQNILKIAQYIVDKWPDQKEAEEALNTLIPFLIKAGRLDDAEKYVQQIPETSSYRGMAELKTGQALWANYLVGMKEIRELEGDLAKWEQDGFPEGRTAASVQADLAKLKAPLDTLKKRAQQTLVDGVKRMQAAGDVNPIIASAVLSLAQIYVDTNQAGQAVALLEDPKIGALTLVNKKDESVAREGFAEEVYKTALRAYISSLAGSKNADETVGKAKQIMAALKERLGTTPEGAQKLVMNYVSVAKDLKTQLDIAPDDATRGNLAKGFEAFLKQVGDQANEFNVLNWVAETFKSMGDAFGRDKANRPKREALDYYNQAIAMYDKILKAADKDKNFLPNPKVLPAVQQSLAMSYRDVGKFKDAADQFRAILAANPGLIGVQMEAAYNYQAWAGYDSKSTKYYKSAILGWQDPKTGKAVIWGWKPMSDKIAGDQRFQDQYYEARYNLAVCRFKYGQSLEKNDPEREKVLNAAKLDVVLLAQLYPELGGDKWRSKFDTLLRQIQRESGDKAPKGLAAVPKESSTSTKPMGTN
jgi:tetratricopeptide (TPR) repeat protein